MDVTQQSPAPLVVTPTAAFSAVSIRARSCAAPIVQQLCRCCWFGLLIAALASACVEHKKLSREPSAGSWRPVVLASGSAIRLPAPPEAGSDQQRAEIDELLSLQEQLTPGSSAIAQFWNTGASVRWNEIARELVAKYRTPPPLPSRVYALLSVAQYDTLVAVWNNKYVFNRPLPNKLTRRLRLLAAIPDDPSYPSEHAAVAAASAAVLAYLFPTEAEWLEKKVVEHQQSRLLAGASFRSDIVAGDELGRAVAKTVIEYAREDRSDLIWIGQLPAGEGRWVSGRSLQANSPRWREVQPWLMSSVTEYRALPPPAFGSPEFIAALAEVKHISDTRDPEQARVAALWADGPGSYAPAGRWNKIAADLIRQYEFNEIRAARVLALMNMAVMDAGIACWDSKFYYLVMRPAQADPSIVTTIGMPNFPSYTSAHAAFSGAAAEVLGHLFLQEQDSLRAKAEEAALSRMYGGIHYRFDGDAGLAQGRAIAQLAIQRSRTDGFTEKQTLSERR